MKVQDDMARVGAVDGDLGSGDAAKFGGGHGHISRQRLRGYQLLEQAPLLVDIDAFGEG
jgi:hypothetical protein